ncbi:MAG: T9SS type A sorting domain-containing protein [Bacteroidota bacterium]
MLKKTISLLLLCCQFYSLSAQEIISVEAQDRTLAVVLNFLLPIRANYNVDNYKVRYTTVDALGQPDTASGLLTVPVSNDLVFPIAVYNHGTVGERENVPSNPEVGERLLVHALATNGYITLAPDYIGLGDSDGIHPYVHAASEASAGRDLIIAAKKWLETEGIPFNDQLFLTGYSQGGHATQALHRDLETNPGEDDLVVTSATHLSGPYSISEVMVSTLFAEELATLPGYIAYTYISYNSVYGVYDSLGQVFVDPYLPAVDSFANELTSLSEFNARLDTLLRQNDAILADILQDSVRAVIASGDPTEPINVALADNDTYDWAPVAPTLIYYCTEDEQVPFRNAIIADSVMRANGSTNVLLETGGARDHGGCVTPAALRTIDFWKQFQNVTPVSLGTPVNQPNLSLAPNPIRAGAELQLNGLPFAQQQYHIYDATGRAVTHGTTSSQGTLALPAQLQPGLHVLRVGLADGTSVVRKVIVKD